MYREGLRSAIAPVQIADIRQLFSVIETGTVRNNSDKNGLERKIAQHENDSHGQAEELPVCAGNSGG